MPYNEEELKDNLYYQSLKSRDEVAYNQKYQKAHNSFMKRESEFEENDNKRLNYMKILWQENRILAYVKTYISNYIKEGIGQEKTH